MAQYAEITSLVATPSPAPVGSRVDVVIKVKNIYSSPVTILSQYNCGDGGPAPYYVTQPDGTVDRGTINPGEELTVLGAFTMGSADVTVYAYSWWYGSDGQYHFDDQKQIAVHLGATPPAPTLTITEASIQQGSALSFQFTGFQPNASVWVGVVGGGGIYITADSSGKGTGSFTDNDTPGNYTLQATDDYGHSATVAFTVTSPPPPATPQVSDFKIADYVKA